MHKLLERQIRRFLQDTDLDVPAEFLQAVDRAYHQADEDRLLLERAMDLTSDELMGRNRDLQREMLERREALAALKATLEATEEGILVVDTDRRTSDHNGRFLAIFGQGPQDLKGSDRGLAIAAEATQEPEEFMARVKAIYDEPGSPSFDTVRLRDGRVIERTSAPQTIQDRIVGRVWSFRDVTSRHEIEERTQNAQKMEAVGRLAGGIAHDFNNLLTVIQGFSELGLGHLGKGDHEKVTGHLQHVGRAARRAAELTGKLLALSRQQVLQPQPIDLTQMLQELRQVFERVLGERVELSIESPAGNLTIFADPGSLEQVLLNLVLNARDAMPSGGKLMIVLSRLDPASRAGAQWIELRVTDTGAGIEEDVLPNIFEPFFSTKDFGKGTGLGLASAHGIIQQSGGEIEVESALGRGTSFHIRFPASVGMVPLSKPAPDPLPRRDATTIRILAVEDDPTVRLILVESLRYLGYRVIEASDPTSCLEVFMDSETGIDLLITDIVMPVLSGFELADILSQASPGLRVLYVSGYDPEARSRLGQAHTKGAFLSKPFSAATLDRKIREVLNLEPAETP